MIFIELTDRQGIAFILNASKIEKVVPLSYRKGSMISLESGEVVEVIETINDVKLKVSLESSYDK